MCIFVGAVLAETIRLWLRYRLFSVVCHDVSQVMSLRISSVSMWLSVVSPIAVTHKMLVDARCRSVPCVASSSFLGYLFSLACPRDGPVFRLVVMLMGLVACVFLC